MPQRTLKLDSSITSQECYAAAWNKLGCNVHGSSKSRSWTQKPCVVAWMC